MTIWLHLMAFDADGDVIERRFDGLGRATLIKDALANTTEVTYDDNSNVIRVTDTDKSTLAVGATETFTSTATYDELNRRLTSVVPNSETTTFEYNERDRLKKRIER